MPRSNGVVICDMKKLLIEEISQGNTERALTILSKDKTLVNTQTSDGATILHLCSIKDGAEVPDQLKALLAWGADPLLMMHNHTAYDLAVKTNKTANAQILRKATLKAIMKQMAKQMAQVAVVNVASPYLLPSGLHQGARVVLDDYLRYATLTGAPMRDMIALQAGVDPSKLPEMILRHKAIEIGAHQGGILGSLPTQAVLTTLLLHGQWSSNFGILVTDPVTAVSVHTTLGMAYCIGARIGEILGKSIALKRLAKDEQSLRPEEMKLVFAYKNLGHTACSLYYSSILAGPLYALIQPPGVMSMVGIDSPNLPIAVAGGFVGAGIGAMMDHRTNASLVPTAGIICGGLIGTALALLALSQVAGREDRQDYPALGYEQSWTDRIGEFAWQSTHLAINAALAYGLYKSGGRDTLRSWASWIRGDAVSKQQVIAHSSQ